MSFNVPSRRCARALDLMQCAPAALLVVLLAAGCASPSASAPATMATATPAQVPPQTTTPADSAPALRKGLTAAEIKALLGEPQEVRPYVVEGIESEIWVYQRRVPAGVRQVVVRMQEVPYVDPITGQMRMLQEPVQQQELTTLVETTEVLMFSGTVVEWRNIRRSERSIN